MIDGKRTVTWAVFIGNSRYGEALGDLARDHLDDGLLDVRIVLANQRIARLRLVGALLGGRLHQTPVMDQLCESKLEVRTPNCDSMDVAVDGDVSRLRTPLRLRVDQGALTVISTPEATDAVDESAETASAEPPQDDDIDSMLDTIGQGNA